jgi:hypothetical protein
MVRRGIVIEEYVEVMNEPQEETEIETETKEESVPAEGSLSDTSGPDAPDPAQTEPVPETEASAANENSISKDSEPGNKTP